MTVSSIKVRVIRKPQIKVKVLTRFPADVKVAEFLTVSRDGAAYTFGADYTILDPSPISDPTATLIAVYDAATQSFKVGTLSALAAATSQIEQHITDAGPVDVLPNAGIVRVDQGTGAAITLNLPAAISKTCPVLISDWKADSDVNPITINLSGSDKLPGGLTSLTINAQGASIFLRPIPGVGYVL